MFNHVASLVRSLYSGLFMILAENDYIEVGIGRLFSPPFLSRFLLYRIFESNQALLFHHLETGSVSATSQGKVTTMIATYIAPTVIYAHYCSKSASDNVEDLLKLPAKEMRVPTNTPTIEQFDDLDVRSEAFALPFSDKKIIAIAKEQRPTMAIGKSDYRVTGPVNVSLWPGKVQTAKLKICCTKLSVYKRNTKAHYNVQSVSNWSLTAFDMDEIQRAPLELSLEKLANENV
jgi:hypothetical protein